MFVEVVGLLKFIEMEGVPAVALGVLDPDRPGVIKPDERPSITCLDSVGVCGRSIGVC